MPNQPWELAHFGRIKEWIDRDDPDLALRDVVLDWLATRRDDPYRGVDREPNFPNLWYGTVPGSERGDKAVVVAYHIFETTHTVRGESIATLGTPIA